MPPAANGFYGTSLVCQNNIYLRLFLLHSMMVILEFGVFPRVTKCNIKNIRAQAKIRPLERFIHHHHPIIVQVHFPKYHITPCLSLHQCDHSTHHESCLGGDRHESLKFFDERFDANGFSPSQTLEFEFRVFDSTVLVLAVIGMNL